MDCEKLCIYYAVNYSVCSLYNISHNNIKYNIVYNTYYGRKITEN